MPRILRGERHRAEGALSELHDAGGIPEMVEEERREAREGTSGEALPRTRRTLRGKDSDMGGDERNAHLCETSTESGSRTRRWRRSSTGTSPTPTRGSPSSTARSSAAT